jgi:hypothetical protein
VVGRGVPQRACPRHNPAVWNEGHCQCTGRARDNTNVPGRRALTIRATLLHGSEEKFFQVQDWTRITFITRPPVTFKSVTLTPTNIPLFISVMEGRRGIANTKKQRREDVQAPLRTALEILECQNNAWSHERCPVAAGSVHASGALCATLRDP